MTHTQEIRENIQRLEKTLASNFWNKGYVANCKAQIEMYKSRLQAISSSNQ